MNECPFGNACDPVAGKCKQCKVIQELEARLATIEDREPGTVRGLSYVTGRASGLTEDVAGLRDRCAALEARCAALEERLAAGAKQHRAFRVDVHSDDPDRFAREMALCFRKDRP